MSETSDRLRAVNHDIAQVKVRANKQTATLRGRRAKIVQRLRKEGWSLGQIATEFGVSRARVQQWEAGNGN